MKNKVKITQRGRPPVDIEWPDIVFTAQDVVDTQPAKISRVTIHSKLNRAVDQGKLKVVGKVKTKNGRPRVTYQKCDEVLSVEENQSPLCQG
jgi:hypothetical protein